MEVLQKKVWLPAEPSQWKAALVYRQVFDQHQEGGFVCFPAQGPPVGILEEGRAFLRARSRHDKWQFDSIINARNNY